MNIVVVLRGPAGVGKSTISHIIQDKLGVNWSVIDVDKLKYYMPMKPGEVNRAERSKIAHDVGKFFAREMYAKGYNVILEEMYKLPYNDAVVEYLHENNMKYLKVFLSAPVEQVVERANNREKQKPEAEIRRHYEQIVPYDDDYVIDTTKYSSEEAADLIIAQIRRLQPAS